MAGPLPVVVERPRNLPRPVEQELARRRMDLLARSRGRVLDLDRPEDRAEVVRASVERHVVPAYDTAVSVGQLLRFPDLVAALRGIDRLVVPDGELHLVEPDGRPGFLALLLATAWARSPRLVGFHLGRDVTAAVRATTFVLDDIERFTMSTAVSSLRPGVQVRAVRVAVPVPASVPSVEVSP